MSSTSQDRFADGLRALVLAGGAIAGDHAAPGAGTAGAALLGYVWRPMASKRQAAVIEELGNDLVEFAVENELRYDEVLERLQHPDVFEVTWRAIETATLTADDDHRRRCRAAVLNAYRMPDRAAYNLRFVQMLRELTPAHFELMEWWHVHSHEFEGRSDDLAHEIGLRLQRQADLVRLLVDELDRMGLATIGWGSRVVMSESGNASIEGHVMGLRSLGELLLDFVTLPTTRDAGVRATGEGERDTP